MLPIEREALAHLLEPVTNQDELEQEILEMLRRTMLAAQARLLQLQGYMAGRRNRKEEMLRRAMLTVQARQLHWQGYLAGVRNQKDFP